MYMLLHLLPQGIDGYVSIIRKKTFFALRRAGTRGNVRGNRL